MSSIVHIAPLDLAFAALGGIAIAAACGFRAFLPLLALGLASRLGVVHLGAQAAWLGTDPALVMLAIAALVELLADKVPVLDHALDAAATLVRPAAGALAGWATFGPIHPALAVAAAVVLGAGAFGIHALKAKTRIGSTLLTLGHANPILSVAEDAAAVVLSATAFLAPVIALVLVAAGVTLLLGWRRRSEARSAGGARP
jgi:uncharacterized membrane protein